MSVWEQIEDLLYRAKNSVGRGYSISQNRKGKMPKVRVKTNAGTEYDDLDIITPPGTATYHKDGEKTEYLVLSVNGDLSHAVAIPIGDRANFFKLEKPGFAVHDPNNPKNYALFDEDGVTLKTEGGKAVKLGKDGKLIVEGETTFKQGVVFEGKIKGKAGSALEVDGKVHMSESLKVDGGVVAKGYGTA